MHRAYETDDEDYQPVERLNKSQQKREIHALLEMGKELSAMEAPTLEQMELPPELFTALVAAKSMKHGAQKRQFKFIAKLLRQMNTDSITETLAEIKGRKADQDRQFHRIERWRDRLLAEGPEVVTELLAEYPQADAGQLRQLIRNAKNEQTANKPPKSARALFRLLRDVICQQNP